MSITIQMETTLDVVAKQKALVQEALGPDSAYARLKENLELMYENNVGVGTTGTASVSNALTYTHITSNVNNIAFMAVCQKISGDTAAVACFFEIQSVNGQ